MQLNAISIMLFVEEADNLIEWHADRKKEQLLVQQTDCQENTVSQVEGYTDKQTEREASDRLLND